MTALLARTSHVAIGGRGALAAIADRTVTLAVWDRAPVTAIEDVGEIENLRLTVGASDVANALADAATSCDTPWRAAVHADVAMLARLYADITDAGRLAIRLDRIVTDACWRFHTDYVGVRLISTYAGRGTQWLRQDATGDDAPEELAAGAVGLFKGRLLAGDRAIVHRSPPIAGTGEQRLLLVIDEVHQE